MIASAPESTAASRAANDAKRKFDRASRERDSQKQTNYLSEGMSNLAPFALFNLVSYKPPYVMFAPTGQVRRLKSREGNILKDTFNNVMDTKQFVVNMATWKLRNSVWLSSVPAPPDIDEFEITGLTPIASEIVAPPRVKESPVHLECIYSQTIKLPHEDPELMNHLVIGKVVGVHIKDSVIKNGIIDEMKLEPMARLGYFNYTLKINIC